MKTYDLGKIEQVDVREIWGKEDTEFTPWLAKQENIERLGLALGIDLVVDQTPIITDPGSFCYSRDLEIRSLYKSYKSHFVPRTTNMIYHSKENNDLFYTENFFRAECEFIDNKSFLGKITYKNTILYRWLCIKENGLDIIDFSTTDCLHKYEVLESNHFISSNYGRLTNKKIIKRELFIL